MGNWKLFFPGNSEKQCRTGTSHSFYPRGKGANVFINQLLTLIGGGLLLGSINFTFQLLHTWAQ